MKTEMTTVHNFYGVTSKEKKLIYNALSDYRKGFQDVIEVIKDIDYLMFEFDPNKDSPAMDSEKEKEAIAAAHI